MAYIQILARTAPKMRLSNHMYIYAYSCWQSVFGFFGGFAVLVSTGDSTLSSLNLFRVILIHLSSCYTTCPAGHHVRNLVGFQFAKYDPALPQGVFHKTHDVFLSDTCILTCHVFPRLLIPNHFRYYYLPILQIG